MSSRPNSLRPYARNFPESNDLKRGQPALADNPRAVLSPSFYVGRAKLSDIQARIVGRVRRYVS
jgi:hypothetical protein